MANEAMLAFFSYSRHDSEFALKLAKDLRQHGAAVWLDQLDINPGERWDSTVEQALANCPKMLLILSPDSVDSTNVMDEVSFALEEHKTVIPVLYRDCKIPFRLRRVQYVDARPGYDWGLRELLRVLGVAPAHEGATAGQKPIGAAAVAAAVHGAQEGQIYERQEGEEIASREKAEQERIERERAEAARVAKQREESESARAREKAEQERIEREQAEAARVAGQRAEAAAKASDQRLLESATLAGATKEPKTRGSRPKLLIGGVIVVVLLGVGISLMTSKKHQEPANPVPPVQSDPLAPVESNPPVPAQSNSQAPEQKAAESSIPEEKKPSEPTVSTQWVTQFLQVGQGPDVEALRPYFSDVVSPYYSLPSADWAAIANDRRNYLSRFPTIQYRLVGEPEFRPNLEGGRLDFDLAYDNIRNDGHRATGTTHVIMAIIRVEGAWKIAGIREAK